DMSYLLPINRCIDSPIRKHPHILLDQIFKQLSWAPGPNCGTRILHIRAAEASAFSQPSPPKPKVRLRHLPNLNQPALAVLEVARIIAAQDRLASAFSEGIFDGAFQRESCKGC
ncbi:hypothetical protein ACL7TT_15505, partial [Microbulbifer sp. 2304DJ12-6]|uniref:hypothetical protein n=1 Tax=Microbulbifer sp. 2304DJ12-6 TaxID=3233340 RepID=UPI0039AFE96F